MISSNKVINLSGGYIIPRVNESYNRKPWVSIGLEGENDFFDVLIKRYSTSPTNQTCIDGLTDLIYGKGVAFKDNPLMTEYFESLTNENDIRKIVFDYKLYGNVAIQVHFTADRQNIKAFYHIPVNLLRAEKCDEQGNIRAYYYCTDWTSNKLRPTRIPAFNSGEYEGDIQILYVKRYTPGQYYYSNPDYFAGIQYCAVEEEISNLHINNIINNFQPTSIINFNSGLPPEEEQFQIEQDIKNKFTGTSNSGRFIVSFNENPEYATTISSISQTNVHENYRFIAEEALNKIMVSHRITSQLLFGIKSAAGFSSNAEELKLSLDVLNTIVISPVQKELLEAFEMLLEYNGADGTGIMFEPLVIASLQQEVGQEVAQDIAEQAQVSEQDLGVNEHIKSMSGRQYQQLQRIVREYNKGKLTEPQARQMLKAAYGMSDEDVNLWLNIENTELEEVTCSECGWSWEEEDGYVCHKCGKDNSTNLSEVELESFADYGDDVKNNAKRGIELNEKNGNKCATQTGKIRAQQLANGESISVQTISRMYSYLSRAEKEYDKSDESSDCANISYLLWGGKAALSWSRNKLRELGKLED